MKDKLVVESLEGIERFVKREGNRLVYTLQILSQDTLEELKQYIQTKPSIKVLDLTKPGIHQKLLPTLYELALVRPDLEVELEFSIKMRYNRLRDGGYFEKLKNPERYMQQVLTNAMQVGSNWLVYEDLSQEDVKYVIEVLDYGALIQKQEGKGFNLQELDRGKDDIRLRYRRLKPYLTQPKVLFDFLTHNHWDTSQIWEMGYWTWDELILPECGLHLPSNELEYYTMELLRGVLDGRYIFE